MNPERNDNPRPTEDELEDIVIETDGTWEAPIEEGVDPRRNPSLVAVKCGRPRGEPQVFVHAAALEKALKHTEADRSNEVGGVLLGEFYHSRGKLVTEVRGAMEAPATRAGVSHVTFSHETWTEINRRKDVEFPDLRIVGWYHSHPNIGVFMSRQDEFIQEHFFFSGRRDKPDGHVALVIDPVKREIVIYTWRAKHGRNEETVLRPASGLWISAERPEQARAFKSLRYTIPGARRRRPGLLARLMRRDGGP